MRRTHRLAAAVMLLAIAQTTGGALSAQAATMDDPGTTWETASVTAEYGSYWELTADAPSALAIFEWEVTGTMSGVPSGYAPTVSSYRPAPESLTVYVQPGPGRPLSVGTYTATVTLTEFSGTGTAYTSPPATLKITPAALATTLRVTADPSNPANAIISTELTGPFRDFFFTSTYAEGPLSPAGTWHITATDESGEVVHEVTTTRADTDDVMALSSYWSDIPPGAYVVRATFTPSGASAQNFAITDPAAVNYAAAPAPGATSTATPAPPAPPAASDDSGLTLPAWIPLIAGVLSAGLLALVIVQIVRLRRVTAPQGSEG